MQIYSSIFCLVVGSPGFLGSLGSPGPLGSLGHLSIFIGVPFFIFLSFLSGWGLVLFIADMFDFGLVGP